MTLATAPIAKSIATTSQAQLPVLRGTLIFFNFDDEYSLLYLVVDFDPVELSSALKATFCAWNPGGVASSTVAVFSTILLDLGAE